MSMPPSTASPARGTAAWPQRVPAPMILLAVPSLLIGIFGALLSMNTVTESLAERRVAVERTRDAAVRLVDSRGASRPAVQGGPVAAQGAATAPQGPAADVAALGALPPEEVKRLGALLGDALYERRGALVPLSLMNLILCWLLVAGALGALRRREFAVSMWRWAALANIPFAALSLLVVSVRTRAVVGAVGPIAATALAAASKRPMDVELQAVKALAQGYLSVIGLWYAGSALLFAVTALYLRRAVPGADDEPRVLA